MDRICYKVVDQPYWPNKAYCSAMHKSLPIDFILEYKLGMKTMPIRGKIFVFSSLEEAKYFGSNDWFNMYHWLILKGVAERVGRVKYIGSCSDFFHCDDFWQMVKRKKSLRNKSFTKTSPKGTLSCVSFTPTEIV